jgi:hypothetical protein
MQYLSRVLGPDRMCGTKVIDASITGDDIILNEGIAAKEKLVEVSAYV